ncbi:hypothetical protein MKZ38_002194 [Zalerion maritima]|uniref:O-methyltransferase C-terminal domain-containing protein n=1 Tax=Zalerion maritima TaxID=339359 RepID=A0AAD5RP86_9PEZI|nr:hypothetical protein MKZ38_002194 [Zalerion maritima]
MSYPSPDAIISSLSGLSSASFLSEADRIRVRDALFETLRKVQSPWDLAWEQNWVNPATNAAIKTLIDAGVFTKWNETNPDSTKTCAQLAEMTGAEEELVRRMVRQVAAQKQLVEVGPDTYSQTPWSRAVGTVKPFPGMYGGFYHELNSPMFRTLPFYLGKTGFKNPTNVNDCNFQFWHDDPNANMFQYVGTNPKLTGHFNDAMECHSRYNLTPWPEVYPTDTVIAAAKEKAGKPLVVDVGGGKGHDLEKFLASHPDSVPEGSLILQDLPDILRDVKPETSAISVQPHDFFTPQPDSVKGARVYFMHNVLHDWPNPKALEILKHIADAMEKGYSRLLIHESLVSSEKPLLRVTSSDITMMACLAAAERSEDEWHRLIKDAGMKVVKIWRPVQSVESVIEVELA